MLILIPYLYIYIVYIYILYIYIVYIIYILYIYIYNIYIYIYLAGIGLLCPSANPRLLAFVSAAAWVEENCDRSENKLSSIFWWLMIIFCIKFPILGYPWTNHWMGVPCFPQPCTRGALHKTQGPQSSWFATFARTIYLALKMWDAATAFTGKNSNQV